MISLRIYKCPDKKKRERIRRCAKFFIAELLPKKKRLSIKIFLESGLLKKHEMSGSCGAEDEQTNKRHYEFTIHLEQTLSEYDILSILAHELTHVKQYATGQLLYDPKCVTNSIWEGKVYDDTKIKYEKQPWEIDAVKHEVLLIGKLLQTDIWKK